MGSTLVILLIAWIGFDAAVAAVFAWRARKRRARRRPGHELDVERVDGYGALLLSRVLVQTCRAVGASQACLLVRDPGQPEKLVPVAARGLDETLIGRRIESDDDGFAVELTVPPCAPAGPWAPEAPARRGAAVPVVRATVGDCGYLWAAPGPRGDFGYGQARLLGELAEQHARALDDVQDPAALDESIGRALALVCEDDDPAAAGRHTALARAIGGRLGLDVPALIELDMAARVQHAVPIAPAAAVRALPGFQAVGIVLRFAHERWDGGGPHGLRGDRIPLASRVLAVCHEIGAPHDATLRAIQGASGSRFDPAVVNALSHELLGPVPELEPERAGWAELDRLFADVGAG